MPDSVEPISPSSALRTPPYVSFKTFLTLIEDMKTNGVPPRMDKSVLKRFSGGVGAQLIMGAKSLGLLIDDNQPTPLLEKLVATFNTPAFKPVLVQALDAGFPFLRGLDLKTATPSMFAEAFKNGTSAKEDVLKKCRRFYLNAAQHVGLELGPRLSGIARGDASTAATTPKRQPSPKAETKRKPREQKVDVSLGRDPPRPDLTAQLLEKFPTFDPAWSDDLKAKWFEGFDQLMARSGGQK
jgi:hypothetical protein